MKVETAREDKVLFPETGITKGDVIDYYRRCSKLLLRHAGGRPLSFRRCPDGIGDCFFQKDKPEHFPDAIPTVAVKTETGTLHHVVIEDSSHLVYLANQGCIELHAPLARNVDLHKPDMVIFDLDPPESGRFAVVKRAARAVRDELDQAGLKCLLKTTGSKGLHVVVPIRPEHHFDAVRAWARERAKALASRHPDWLTTEVRKAKRGGRLFLDVARNAYGQTAVAPYSLRAIEGAPVATPIDWTELGGLESARQYHLDNLFRRLGQRDDPWAGFGRYRQRLSPG